MDTVPLCMWKWSKNKHEYNWFYLRQGSFYIFLHPQIPFCASLLVEMWVPSCLQCLISIFCFELYHPDSWLSVCCSLLSYGKALCFRVDEWIYRRMKGVVISSWSAAIKATTGLNMDLIYMWFGSKFHYANVVTTVISSFLHHLFARLAVYDL